MTVLLLCCSSVLRGNTTDTLSLRGMADSLSVSDTLVSVPISDIRSANIKMMERKMYRELVAQKDTVIAFKDSYIAEQESIIKDFQERVVQYDEINSEIAKSLERQKKVTYIVGGVAGAALITTVVFIFAK